MTSILKTLVVALVLLGGCEYQVSGCDGPVCVSAAGGGSNESHHCTGYAGCASVCPAKSVVDKNMLREVTLARRLYRSCPGSDLPSFPNMTFDQTLDTAARFHAFDMARYNFESTIGSDGLGVHSRVAALADSGFSLDNHLTQLVASGAENALDAVDYWLASPVHCAQLLSEHYNFLGAACASDGQRSRWSVVLGGP